MLFFIRYLLVVFVFFGASLLYHPYLFFRKKRPEALDPLIAFLRKVLFKIMGVKLIVNGKENLPKNQGMVLIGNHQHNLDAFVFGLNASF